MIKFIRQPTYQVPFLITIALIGMSFPYGFPLFSFVGFLFLCINFFQGKVYFKINAYIGLYFASVIAYVLGIIFSNEIKYSLIKNDLTNIISFAIIYIVFSGIQKNDYNKIINILSTMVIKSGFVLSLISIYKYYMLLKNVKIGFFQIGSLYPWGTSLVVDYNMFSYSLIISLVLLLFAFNNNRSARRAIINSIMLFTISFSILFSGSRRGLAVFIIIWIYLLITKSYKTIKKGTLSRRINNTKIGIIIGLLIIIIFGLYLFSDNSLLKTYEFDKIIYRANTIKISQLEKSFAPRISRWAYALDIADQSGYKGIIMGTGFDYIANFTNKYSNNINIENHPHMPLLSSLLYSGIIGFLITITTYLAPIFLMIKRRKHYGRELLSIYIISLLFFSVSSNSVFSVKMLSILQILIFVEYSNILKKIPQ